MHKWINSVVGSMRPIKFNYLRADSVAFFTALWVGCKNTFLLCPNEHYELLANLRSSKRMEVRIGRTISVKLLWQWSTLYAELSPNLQTFSAAQESIPSLDGRFDNPIWNGPPGYKGWQNRFLGVDFLESMPGLLKLLQIWAQVELLLGDIHSTWRNWRF